MKTTGQRTFIDPPQTPARAARPVAMPRYPYTHIAALGTDATQARRLAAEMSGVTALAVIAAGATGYSLAAITGRNRGEALQAAVAGWLGAFAVHWIYHLVKPASVE